MSVFTVQARKYSQEVDAAEIARAASILFDPESFVQIMGTPFNQENTATVAAGDMDEVVRQVRRLSDGTGTYYIANPIKPGITQCAKKDDILHRRWLLIDCDPAQHKVNANEEEHQAARDLATDIFTSLSTDGWPYPVSIDSGNGWHLLYRIDLPNDEESQAMLRNCLKVIASRFNNKSANIEERTFTAKQVAKMPGTWARRSPSEPDRPQRLVKLNYVPTDIEVVSAELLKSMAREYSDVVPIRPAMPVPVNEGPIWRLRAGASNDRRAYLAKALAGEVQLVVMSSKGRNNQVNESAFKIGQIAAECNVSDQEIIDAFTIACHANGLMSDPNDGAHKTTDTIKRAIAAGRENPRHIQPLNGKPMLPAPTAALVVSPNSPPVEIAQPDTPTWETIVDGEVRDEGDPRKWLADSSSIYASIGGKQSFEFLSLPDLLNSEFPEPSWVVPGILSEGLNILVGKPKIGKSMLSLNLAITIAAGGMALGSIQTVPGDVLYLALEDKGRRLQSRARKMMTAIGVQASRRLRILTRFPRQDCGGMDMLHYWASKIAERPVLIIIDVLRQFRTPAPQRGNAYEADYQVMSWIKNLVDFHECSALVVHHSRKGESEDPMEDTSGTNGLNGACDGVLTLRRARNTSEACIHVTGRDVVGQELAIRFDDKSLNWTSLGDAKELTTSKVRRLVLETLKASGGASFWPKEIAEMINENANTVRSTLWRMEKDGMVMRRGDKYSWPGPGERIEMAESEAF